MRFKTSKGKTLSTDSNINPPVNVTVDTNYAAWDGRGIAGEVIIRFAGRGYDALDAIQPLVLRLSAATWKPNDLRAKALAAAR